MGKTKVHKGTQTVGDVQIETAIVVDTTECERLAKIAAESQAIGAFLDWLRNERKLAVCELQDVNGYGWFPVQRSIHDLLAEYFEIDQTKLEDERRALLEALRR